MRTFSRATAATVTETSCGREKGIFLGPLSGRPVPESWEILLLFLLVEVLPSA